MMYARFLLLFVGAFSLCFLGCDTMKRAREAQKDVIPDMIDPADVAVPVDEMEEDIALTNEPNAQVQAMMERVSFSNAHLADFVAFALTNRPDLVQAALVVETARLAVKSVEADEWPQLGISGGYSQSTQNGGSHFSWHQDGKANTSISFDLLLYDFGRLDAQEAAARENAVAAELAFAQARLQTFKEVASAYFTVLQNDALLAVAVTNEQQYAEHLQQAEILFKAGETKNLDVLKARLDLSQAHLDTITASNDVVTAEAEFIRALGIAPALTSRAELLAVSRDPISDYSRVLTQSHDDALKLLADARAASPSLMTLRAKLRAASSRVDYAVADLLPSLSLTSAFSWSDPAWNWGWGVSAVQSLFQGFRKTTAVDTAVADMRTAREALIEEEQSLGYRLAVAVSVRDTANQALESAQVQVVQAKENYENVVAQYRVGEASRIDFTDAASSYAEALGSQVKAFYSGQIAEAALYVLTGLPVIYAQ